MNKNIIIFIIIIAIHFIFINGLEKQIISFIIEDDKIIKRPNYVNKNIFYTNDINGMPSGHMELIVFISLFFIFKLNISRYIGLSIILLMGVQRYYSNRHNIIQIVTGIFFSLVYFAIYNSFNFSYISIFICVLILLVYLHIIDVIINNKMKEKIPKWVDPSMYKKIEEKKKTNIYTKYFSILFSLSCMNIDKTRLYISWDELENMLEKIMYKITETNKYYNGIVGIKSGGAIISDYISKKLNIKNYKIKLSLIQNNCRSGTTMKDIILSTTINEDARKFHKVCEGIETSIENNNVILIDELCSSGYTMFSAIDYLYNVKKVNSVFPITLTKSEAFENRENRYYIHDILKNYLVLCWPWGWDN